jgi:hypothetical protein
MKNNHNILLEINRMREIMGLNLINEGVIKPSFIERNLYNDAFKQDLVNMAEKTLQITKKNGTTLTFDDLVKMGREIAGDAALSEAESILKILGRAGKTASEEITQKILTYGFDNFSVGLNSLVNAEQEAIKKTAIKNFIDEVNVIANDVMVKNKPIVDALDETNTLLTLIDSDSSLDITTKNSIKNGLKEIVDDLESAKSLRDEALSFEETNPNDLISGVKIGDGNIETKSPIKVPDVDNNFTSDEGDERAEPKKVSTTTRMVDSILGSISPFLLSKTTRKNITDELYRLLPEDYLTDPKEVSKMISRLSSLGPDLNKLNVNYIKKYGQKGYDDLLRKYIFNGDKKSFLSSLKNVQNPNFRIKPIMGYGADHQVYESILYPDRVIKQEVRPGEIDKWYDIFVNNPELFPKVYKKVKIKGKNGEKLSAAVMEKLNVGPFQNLWDEIEGFLQTSQKNLPVEEKFSLEYLIKRRGIYKKQWSDFLNYLKNNETKNSDKIDEFIKLVDKLYTLTDKPDIRKLNFGYDKNGILKSLDL